MAGNNALRPPRAANAPAVSKSRVVDHYLDALRFSLAKVEGRLAWGDAFGNQGLQRTAVGVLKLTEPGQGVSEVARRGVPSS